MIKFDRSTLRVEVHQTLVTLEITLVDTEHDATLELESKRLGNLDVKALLELLKLSEDHLGNEAMLRRASRPDATSDHRRRRETMTMTFSIVARDPATGDLGIAIASKALAVGAVAPFARARVGAISTQAMPNVAYGPDALARLADGEGPEAVLAALTAADAMAAHRQAGSWTRSDGPHRSRAPAAWTGPEAGPRPGSRPGQHPDRAGRGGRHAGRLPGRHRHVSAPTAGRAPGGRSGWWRQSRPPVRGAAGPTRERWRRRVGRPLDRSPN